MIPRTVVPRDCRPAAGLAEGRRRSTKLDDRVLLPPELPVVPFSGPSLIPAHVPLSVLENRVLIPRDLPVVPLAPSEHAVEESQPPTELDRRVVVPPDARLNELPPAPLPVEELRVLGEGGILVEGEPRLLPELPRRLAWEWLAPVGSIVAHLLLLVFLLNISRVLVAQPEQVELALEQPRIGYIYLPRSIERVPKPVERPQKPSDKIRVDLGALRRLAPLRPEVSPERGPARSEPVTPPVSQQTPQSALNAAPPSPPPAPPARPARPQPRLEPVVPESPSGLLIPRLSPGRAIEQSLRAAVESRQAGIGFADRLPPPPAPGGLDRPGGPGPGYLAGSLQVLTPTQGVDFTSYFARMLAVVRRNWYTLMPESARLGDRGRVVLRFRILRDGEVASGEPILEMSSGKDPLDRAAVGAITLSNPFEPLPQAFTGPYIELRFIFLYNLPLNSQ
jgi:TonB family protein